MANSGTRSCGMERINKLAFVLHYLLLIFAVILACNFQVGPISCEQGWHKLLLLVI